MSLERLELSNRSEIFKAQEGEFSVAVLKRVNKDLHIFHREFLLTDKKRFLLTGYLFFRYTDPGILFS